VTAEYGVPAAGFSQFLCRCRAPRGAYPDHGLLRAGRYCWSLCPQVRGTKINDLNAGQEASELARGPLPKSVRSRRDDNARRQAETIEFQNTGSLAGSDLPEGVLPDGASWHPQTRQLWDELRTHPLLQDEPGLTWAFLIDTAALHSLMWSNGRWDVAAELRLRLAKIGVSQKTGSGFAFGLPSAPTWIRLHGQPECPILLRGDPA